MSKEKWIIHFGLQKIEHEKKLSEDFFTKYGNELVCITGWLAEPRFTVNELVAAIEAKIRSNK